MKNTYLNIIISVISFAIILWFLLLNFGAERMPDEIPQVSQWRNFFFRGMFALPALAMLLFLRRKRAIEVLLWSICVAATVEAVLGLMQLYGYRFSNHGIFRLTGSFYNPGPLGGYIAVAFPLVLSMVLKRLKYKVLHYTFVAVLVLYLIVLPSTMSRTAWLSALVASLYVVCFTTDYVKKMFSKLQTLFSKHQNRKVIVISSTVLVLIACVIGVWKIKSESAFGRFFLWKISSLAVMDSPITGHDNFSVAYGEAQQRYFQSKFPDNSYINVGSEENLATVPDYAFNEYLNIAVEYGLPVLLLVIGALIMAFVFGHKRGRYGFCGGLIAFAVFAFASYPIHIPAFVAVLIILVAGAVWPENDEPRLPKIVICVVAMAFMALCALRLGTFQQRYESMKKWEKIRFLYSSKLYERSAVSYSNLYDELKWNGRFLYEYGHSLFKTQKYLYAEEVLLKSSRLSGDPMIWNVIGECEQAIYGFAAAEQYYLRSLYCLPSRMYPYYLLYKLYCQEGFYNPNKRKSVYKTIVSMPVKIKSPAIDEMLNEVKATEPTLKQRDEEYYHYQNYIRRIPPYFHRPSDI
ncbi:MAG: O-antigen ligase family protein [Bacteroidales bacterium]|nr:O-antigen ligase family protein [Bacteroidales bacterium]